MKTYSKMINSQVQWLGEVPMHWCVKRLKYLASVQTGYTPPKGDEENYDDDGMLWVKPDDLNEFHTIEMTSESISKKGLISNRVVKPFCPLVCCIGSIGKFGVSSQQVITNQQINAIIFNRLIDNIYGLYVISISGSEHQSLANKNVVPILNSDSQKNIYFCLPPISEQNQISTFLDRESARIDALISKKERMIELLKEKRIALITQAVTKGLDPNAKMKDSGIEWLGEVPEHWEIVKLKFIGNALIGLTYSPDSIVFENGILVLRASNIQDSSLSLDREDDVYVETQIPSKLMVIENDILICSRNGSRALIGKSAVVKGIVHATFGAFMTVYRSRFNTFIRWVLQSSMFSSLCSGYVTSTINQLTQDSLNNITVPLPPENEIERISEFLESEIQRSETLIVKTENSITLLREYRSSLIHSAVTGKIDLRDYHELDV